MSLLWNFEVENFEGEYQINVWNRWILLLIEYLLHVFHYLWYDLFILWVYMSLNKVSYGLVVDISFWCFHFYLIIKVIIIIQCMYGLFRFLSWENTKVNTFLIANFISYGYIFNIAFINLLKTPTVPRFNV